jgi:5-methylcytosine-specific restriction endonuclease McrA
MEFNNTPYGNYKMVSTDGGFLAFTDKKRMNWYVSRNLAILIDKTTYQLNFATEGDGNWDKGDYYKLALENKCVVCGDNEELTRHHIVPSQYRKLLSIKYKGRNSYDIVAICNTCHAKYEREADKLKEHILINFGLSTYTKDNARIKKYHHTLKYFRENIRAEK